MEKIIEMQDKDGNLYRVNATDLRFSGKAAPADPNVVREQREKDLMKWYTQVRVETSKEVKDGNEATLKYMESRFGEIWPRIHELELVVGKYERLFNLVFETALREKLYGGGVGVGVAGCNAPKANTRPDLSRLG